MLPDSLTKEARKYWAARPHKWRVIYTELVNYRMTNMVNEGTDEPYPLVDNMSCEDDTIQSGELELVYLADEIHLALERMNARPARRHRR